MNLSDSVQAFCRFKSWRRKERFTWTHVQVNICNKEDGVGRLIMVRRLEDEYENITPAESAKQLTIGKTGFKNSESQFVRLEFDLNKFCKMTTSSDQDIRHSLLRGLWKHHPANPTYTKPLDSVSLTRPTAVALACYRITLQGLGSALVKKRLEFALENGEDYEELALKLKRFLSEQISRKYFPKSNTPMGSKSLSMLPKLMTINEIYESDLGEDEFHVKVLPTHLSQVIGIKGDLIVRISGPMLFVYEYLGHELKSPKFRWMFKHIRSFGVEEDITDEEEPVLVLYLLMGSRFPEGRGRIELLVVNPDAPEMYSHLQKWMSTLKNSTQQSNGRIASSFLANSLEESPLPAIEETEQEGDQEEELEVDQSCQKLLERDFRSDSVETNARPKSLTMIETNLESAIRRVKSCNFEPVISSSLSGLKRLEIESLDLFRSDFKFVNKNGDKIPLIDNANIESDGNMNTDIYSNITVLESEKSSLALYSSVSKAHVLLKTISLIQSAERTDSQKSYVRETDGIRCREAENQTPNKELVDEEVGVTDDDILPPTPSPSQSRLGDPISYYESAYPNFNIASTPF